MPERSSAEIRASIEEQRTLLAGELEQLRTGLAEVTDWRKQLREHKREAMIAAAVAGFVVAGGIGALSGALRRRRR
jgi:hypothetical protein